MITRTLCAVFISQSLLSAQAPPAAVGETAIPEPFSVASPSLPAPKPELPEYVVKREQVRKVVLEEPAPFPDMQPVRKEVTLTVRLVEDPHLPVPPPPPLSLRADPNDPAVAEFLAAMRAQADKRVFVFLSATVYDHQRTLLSWHANGKPDQTMTAWSNLDFNHFTGFGDYTYHDKKYSYMMIVTNESTTVRAQMARKNGGEYQPPVFPELPTGSPAFVVTKGDQNNLAAMDVVTGLHELYKVEGTRMRAACVAREQANRERETYLRANPPQPQNVTTWIAELKRIDLQPVQTSTHDSGR